METTRIPGHRFPLFKRFTVGWHGPPGFNLSGIRPLRIGRFLAAPSGLAKAAMSQAGGTRQPSTQRVGKCSQPQGNATDGQNARGVHSKEMETGVPHRSVPSFGGWVRSAGHSCVMAFMLFQAKGAVTAFAGESRATRVKRGRASTNAAAVHGRGASRSRPGMTRRGPTSVRGCSPTRGRAGACRGRASWGGR